MDEKQLQRRFGSLIAAHRRRAGKTQEQLAIDAGLSIDMITRIEGGRSGARFPNIVKLATALDVDPAELFTPELPEGALARGYHADLIAKLAPLSPPELRWLEGIIDAALKAR